MLWFALYLPNLPLQVFERGAPEPAASAAPLAVAESRRVAAANPTAQRLGVHAGLGIASALALAPELTIRRREPRAEDEALREIAAWLLQFAPGVSLDPPACVLIEASASLRLFGGPESLMRRLERGCRELGFLAEIAGAPTPLAARWLARGSRRNLILEPEKLVEVLGGLPLGLTDADPQTLELLFAIGAVTLEDCLRLPRAGLARRSAAPLLTALDRALGRQPDPRPRFPPPQRYAARIELPLPAAEAETLLFAARRLFVGLAAWLAARQAGIERYTLHLEHDSREPTDLIVTLGTASRDEARFALLVREHLARLGLECPVTAVALEAIEPAPLAGEPAELFGDARREAEAPPLLIERLRARLGAGAVTGLRSLPDHRPERAWCAAEPGSAQPARGLAAPRPLWLLREPRPLETRDDTPCWHRPLKLLAGPERIESGWWDDAEACRDYFVAAGPGEELLWVFRELSPPHGWYVHGIFA
jgi:protein ImuB